MKRILTDFTDHFGRKIEKYEPTKLGCAQGALEARYDGRVGIRSKNPYLNTEAEKHQERGSNPSPVIGGAKSGIAIVGIQR